MCVYTHILAAFGDSATIFAPAIGTGSGSGAGVAGALQILGPEMAWYSGGKWRLEIYWGIAMTMRHNRHTYISIIYVCLSASVQLYIYI